MQHENALKLKRQIVEKGVKELLEEAKVPMHYHLKVVKKLHKALQDNDKKNKKAEDVDTKNQKEIEQLHEYYGKQIQDLSQELTDTYGKHESQIQGYQTELERYYAMKEGQPGRDGIDAVPLDENAVVSKVLSKMPMPEKGEKGDPGDVLEMDKVLDTVVKRIQKGDVIHINHVKGAGGFIKDGIRYRFEELMHGGGVQSTTPSTGGGVGVAIPTGTINSSNKIFTVTGQVVIAYEDSVLDIGAILSYSAGTNVTTITYSIPPQNNVYAITVGGTPINPQVPTGTVNGSNVTFLSTGKISIAVEDSIIDVNATLSYSAGANTTTITYSIPPQNNVYAF